MCYQYGNVETLNIKFHSRQLRKCLSFSLWVWECENSNVSSETDSCSVIFDRTSYRMALSSTFTFITCIPSNQHSNYILES